MVIVHDAQASTERPRSIDVDLEIDGVRYAVRFILEGDHGGTLTSQTHRANPCITAAPPERRADVLDVVLEVMRSLPDL